MIDKLNRNAISDILKDTSSRQSTGKRISDDNNVDASIQISCASLLEKAKQEPAQDIDVIERARQMLLSGELDNPENIRKAVENIIKFGV